MSATRSQPTERVSCEAPALGLNSTMVYPTLSTLVDRLSSVSSLHLIRGDWNEVGRWLTSSVLVLWVGRCPKNSIVCWWSFSNFSKSNSTWGTCRLSTEQPPVAVTSVSIPNFPWLLWPQRPSCAPFLTNCKIRSSRGVILSSVILMSKCTAFLISVESRPRM